VEKDCQARKLNKEDAVDRRRWRKLIKDVWWSGWVWVGECFFWYRPTRVVPDKGPLNGCMCVCVCVYFFITVLFKTANWHGRWGEGRNYLLGICAIFVVQTCKYIALLYNKRPRTFTVECHELAEGCGVMLVVSSIFTTNVFTHGTIHFDKIKLPPLYSSTLTLNLVTVVNAHKM